MKSSVRHFSAQRNHHIENNWGAVLLDLEVVDMQPLSEHSRVPLDAGRDSVST